MPPLPFEPYFQADENIVSEAQRIQSNNIRDNTVRATQYACNTISYISNFKKFGVAEQWATPPETFRDKDGDCEDFASYVISLCNSMDVKPKGYRVAVGTYAHPLVNTLIAPTLLDMWHAWAEINDGSEWLVADGTVGQVFPQNGWYRAVFYIYPNRIELAPWR